MNLRPHVVIVGAGFGGLEAARRLRRLPVDVTVIDRRNYHLFQPLLYQVATASLASAEISAPIRRILRRQRNTRVLLGEVTAVDLDGRTVRVNGSLDVPYDYLVLATGSVHFFFGHDEWEEHAPGLKSVEEALDIRRRILLAFEAAERETDPEGRRAWLTFALIGAGPTGVELAGAIAELSCETLRPEFRSFDPCDTRVVLLEAMDRVLPGLHPDLSAMAERHLTQKGVEVITGRPVKAVDGGGVTVGDDGLRIEAKTCIWTAGVKAEPLARRTGLPVDRKGKVKVRPDLSVPGHPEVFVIGDLAHFEQDGRPVPDIAQKALQMGRHLARTIRADLKGRARRRFRYRDKGYMVVIGRNAAVADVKAMRFSGVPAWFVWATVHLLWMVGFRNRVFVFLDWAWSYLTNRRSARLIIPSALPETAALGRAEQLRLEAPRLGAHLVGPEEEAAVEASDGERAQRPDRNGDRPVPPR